MPLNILLCSGELLWRRRFHFPFSPVHNKAKLREGPYIENYVGGEYDKFGRESICNLSIIECTLTKELQLYQKWITKFKMLPFAITKLRNYEITQLRKPAFFTVANTGLSFSYDKVRPRNMGYQSKLEVKRVNNWSKLNFSSVAQFWVVTYRSIFPNFAKRLWPY